MAHHYKCVTAGDWGALVSLWERDMDKKQRRDETRQGRRSGRDEEEKLSKEVVGLITSGQISKAINLGFFAWDSRHE